MKRRIFRAQCGSRRLSYGLATSKTMRLTFRSSWHIQLTNGPHPHISDFYRVYVALVVRTSTFRTSPSFPVWTTSIILRKGTGMYSPFKCCDRESRRNSWLIQLKACYATWTYPAGRSSSSLALKYLYLAQCQIIHLGGLRQNEIGGPLWYFFFFSCWDVNNLALFFFPAHSLCLIGKNAAAKNSKANDFFNFLENLYLFFARASAVVGRNYWRLYW